MNITTVGAILLAMTGIGLGIYNQNEISKVKKNLVAFKQELEEVRNISPREELKIDADHFLFRRAVNQIIDEYVENKNSELLVERLAEYSLAAINSSEHRYGKENSPIELYVFSDLLCPYCAKLSPQLKILVDQSHEQISLIFKHYPLKLHGAAAVKRALLLECIARLGNNRMFWYAQGEIFQNINESDLISQLGLEQGRVQSCMRDPTISQAILKDVKEGESLEIDSTPTLVVLDRELNLRVTLKNISSIDEVKRAIAQIKISVDHGRALTNSK